MTQLRSGVVLSVLGLSLCVSAQSPQKAAPMPQARGTFDVTLKPQPTDSALGRMSIDKQFHGDLEGVSKAPAQLPATADAPVAYPEGYRSWVHVKSALVSPAHANFATQGGFQHVYANPEAMAGYRTRAFPEGSIVVFDWLEMRDTAGAFAEGPRRQVDVMVKDSKRFATSGGWGFQRFVKDTKEFAATPTPQQCFACHEKLKKDGLILSSYRQ